MIAVLMALALTLAPSAPPEVPPQQYAEVWAWCAERFPSSTDEQDACRWGAYKMLPTQPITEWRA